MLKSFRMNLRGKVMVVVATMENETRAEIACAKLMVAGIPSEIGGDSTFHWNPFVARAPSTFSIMVPASAAQKAKKILRGF